VPLPVRLRTRGIAALLGGALATATVAAPTEAPDAQAPERIRKAAEDADDLLAPGIAVDAARARLESAGFFCTFGIAPALENVGVRFLVCSPSCEASVADGWWVYLSESIGQGIRFIEAGQANASLIKPFLPNGCRRSAGG
jgi:hypothetical protein